MEGKTYRVVRLLVENYKRILAADVTPGRNAVIVAGKNKAGKSSLLDSIASALGGKKLTAEQPLREGAESGQIVCILGDDPLHPELLVKRTFTADGKTALEITSAEGYKAPSPQAVLDGLCARIAFDPQAFVRMEGHKQVEMLRSLVGLDFSAADQERKKLYDDRTAVNRDATQAKSRAAAISVPDDTPAVSVSIMDLMVELKRRQEVNRKNQAERDKVDGLKTHVDACIAVAGARKSRIIDLETQMAEARGWLEDAERDLEQAEILRDVQIATAKVLEDANTEEIQARIVGAEEINANVTKRAQCESLLAGLKACEARAKELDDLIEEIDKSKKEALAEAAWPVEGLSFGPSGVLYNGLPFCQASSAEQLQVSFAMVSAMNPSVAVALIREASLLDDEQIALVCGLAEKYDMQVWLEKVDSTAGPAGILIEDGTVVARPPSHEATAPIPDSTL